MNPRIPVSVVIPTFNRKSNLRRALKSVLAQSVAVEEIVVIDDGSSDETGAMVRAEFPEVMYIYQSNHGVSKARNLGIHHSTAPWIALLDSDDEWLPNKLEKQFDALENNNGLLLCHSDEIWIRNGKRVNAMNKHQKYGGYIYDKCLPLCAISPSASLIHRRLFENVGLFDESLPACEDYDLWLRICSRYAVLYVDEPMIVKYGGHKDQLSRQYWGMDRFRIKALMKMLDDPDLSETNYRLTMEMLKQKCAIYAQGAAKRGKQDEAVLYQKLVERYSVKLPV